MLEWDGVWITIGGTRVRSITPNEVVEALNDLPAHHEAWRDGATDEPAPTARGLMLWKSRPMIAALAAVIDEVQPHRIFELGIAQGGSTAVLGALAPDAKIVAIDIASEPVAALADHIAGEGLSDRIHPHFGIDQSDRATVAGIIADEFGDEPIDLVIDDASHRLDLTRASFDELFPRVRPGGCYVIEDWSWAHYAFGDTPSDSFLPEGPPLTEMIFEILMALGTGAGAVDRIEGEEDWVRVWRGPAELEVGTWTLSSAHRSHRPITLG